MSTKIIHGSEPLSDTRLPASPETFRPSLDGHPAQSADGLTLDSDAIRILIVDDDPGILTLVSRMAGCLGYHPTTAEDGVDALYYLTKAQYDLVLTDYDMPFIDGYQLAGQIKEKHFGTRVIIMTGHCERDATDMLNGSGIVDGLLLKPFNLKTMKEKIELVGHPRFVKWTHTNRRNSHV
ncbi:MAG: response regulator [Desulfosarcina sp.]|nr:response regulator [Desulfosarcina sp.]MBC2742224.1 response regulator [Desulfosarcina sp.]MBC2765136.1 response regulator [Desulfosarcina sp.]